MSKCFPKRSVIYLFFIFSRKYSISSAYITKIPLNPPLQKGEEVGMPGLFENLPFPIQCWMLDVRPARNAFGSSQNVLVPWPGVNDHSTSLCDAWQAGVHFFQSVLGKNNLALMPF